VRGGGLSNAQLPTPGYTEDEHGDPLPPRARDTPVEVALQRSSPCHCGRGLRMVLPCWGDLPVDFTWLRWVPGQAGCPPRRVPSWLSWRSEECSPAALPVSGRLNARLWVCGKSFEEVVRFPLSCIAETASGVLFSQMGTCLPPPKK
jgi:hypothetical protein